LVGITAFGAYIPKLRLQREAIAKANTRFGPSLATLAGAFGWALNEFVNYR
jgi:3-hydroxy-3-methylglutaryl CoA synthase